MWWCELNWSSSVQLQVESSCECCNELPGSIKYWEVLEWLFISNQLHRVSLVTYEF
jgi:hypothetical protein